MPYDFEAQKLVDQGLARWYRGRLIPLMKGGSGEDEPLFPEIPEDFAALSDEDLQSFIDGTRDALAEVLASPSEFVGEDVSSADLLAASRESVEALNAAREAMKSRADGEETPADEETPALSDEDFQAGLAEIATLAADEEPEADEPPVAAAAEESKEEKEAVTAAADAPAPAPRDRRMPVPARSRRPVEAAQERTVALTAAADAVGYEKGDNFPSMQAIAEAMQERRRHFGLIPEGTSGEKVPIVRANWSDLYPEDRKLGGDVHSNQSLIDRVIDPALIKAEMGRRREKALVASGGLCAPVTPYYQLQMISQASRPVRAALPSFNADRGGIRNAQPASLASVTTAVGVRTAAQDALGGTTATKTCQVIDCPPFVETDVEIIFHCLQFGNLGARTFPELLTQWNNLTLAAHARLAETGLLNGIDSNSTQVTAASLGLGASANLFSQISTAVVGMKSRHRMDPDATLRIMLPWWAVYLLISDVQRGQFNRWEFDAARVTALLRQIDVEPSYYIDSASGKSQVYGTQSAGALLPFPSTVVWYLFPEGSFLYLDGGTLELGLVRDSVLNSTNDFQIFGETFENVAFVGVESLAVTSTVCDNGTVSLPHAVTCPIDYTHTS